METADNGRSFQAVSGFARGADQAAGINEARVSGMDQRPLAIANGIECIAKRSEEHTSELQSLMRISYAVFCLKKKNKHNLFSSKAPKPIQLTMLYTYIPKTRDFTYPFHTDHRLQHN